MTDDRPHIGLLDSTSALTDITDAFYADIQFDGLNIDRRQREEPPVYAALEVNDLPTLIAVFVFSIYFSEFLKQTGKEHATILTRALTRLARKLFHKERDAAIVQSGKITRPALYSILFSIWTIADKCTIKFVFGTKGSEIEYVSTTKAISRFLDSYYTGENLDEYAPIVEAMNTSKMIVVAYDLDSDSFYLV